MIVPNIVQTECGFQKKLISYKTISLDLTDLDIETIYYSIFRERFGISEIVHEGILKPSSQQFDLRLDYDFLLDHKQWSYSFMGIGKGQVQSKLEGSVVELINLKNGAHITFPGFSE